MNRTDTPLFASHKGAVWTSLWDFQRFSVKRSTGINPSLDFFKVPQGATFFGDYEDCAFVPNRVRDENETSMVAAGAMALHSNFYLTGIRCLILPGHWSASDPDSDDADEYKLASSGIIKLIVNSRIMFATTPLARCPAAFPVPRKTRIESDELSIVALKKEIQMMETAYQAISPIYLGNDTFSVSVRYPFGIMGIKRDALIGVILDGYLIRTLL